MCCAPCSAPTLTILAPGCNIEAAGILLSGTSQATPFVSAALTVMRSRFPTYTLPQLVAALTSTGVPVSSTVWTLSPDTKNVVDLHEVQRAIEP